MANILYGVNGEGSGHSSRAREVITHLQAQGHHVRVASFDRGYQNLKDDFEVTEIDGLRLAYVHNRVRYRRTVVRNLLHLPQATRTVRALGRRAEGWDLDLVITDFEPVTCHLGHKLGLPVIAIDNQHLLTDTQISYPQEYRKEAAAAKLVTRLMMPRANAYLVISFFMPRVKKKKTFLFSPILRKEILGATPSIGQHVLVYLTSEAAELTDLLKTVRQSFVCYGFDRQGRDGNIEYCKPSRDNFLRDLSGCRAVIANAGFSLISKALYLGKPYLAWPVKRQFEQIFNAYYISKTGYGAYWDELNKERVESFLFNLEGYREKLASYPRVNNSALFAKLDDEGRWSSGRPRSSTITQPWSTFPFIRSRTTKADRALVCSRIQSSAIVLLTMYSDFEATDRWTKKKMHCIYQALIVAIATRHADAIDIKFLLDGRPVWVALPHPAWVEYQSRTGKLITDSLAIEIAGHYLKTALESGEGVGREMYSLTVDETLRHLEQVVAPAGMPTVANR